VYFLGLWNRIPSKSRPVEQNLAARQPAVSWSAKELFAAPEIKLSCTENRGGRETTYQGEGRAAGDGADSRSEGE
jgi:hypothetical protein